MTEEVLAVKWTSRPDLLFDIPEVYLLTYFILWNKVISSIFLFINETNLLRGDGSQQNVN